MKRKTHEEYVLELAIKNPTVEVIDQYIDTKTPILHHCIVHNKFWKIIPSRALNGVGCPKCAGNLTRTDKEYINKVKLINPYIKPIGDYVNAGTKIPHMCLVDGYIWDVAPVSVLAGYGCPVCRESSGERQVRQWLESYSIEYVYQKIFNDCRDVRELPFDFYLPEYNLCIEYDGGQHFKPVDFAGRGEEWALRHFEKIKRHDKIKDKYCISNNIHLLRIPYYNNIQEELEKFFIHLI